MKIEMINRWGKVKSLRTVDVNVDLECEVNSLNFCFLITRKKYRGRGVLAIR